MTYISREDCFQKINQWTDVLKNPNNSKNLTSEERKEIDSIIKYIVSSGSFKNSPDRNVINQLDNRINNIKNGNLRDRPDGYAANISRAVKNIFGRISSKQLSEEMKSIQGIESNIHEWVRILPTLARKDVKEIPSENAKGLFEYLKPLTTDQRNFAFYSLRKELEQKNVSYLTSTLNSLNDYIKEDSSLIMPQEMRDFKNYFRIK